MTHEGNGLYSYTRNFNPGELIEYKFINGDSWGQDESVPLACATGLNRFLEVPSADAELGPVCFGACESCVPSACQGDFNDDQSRNVNDLLFLLSEMGCNSSCSADLTGDDAVNTADTILFLGLFGSTCP